MLIMTKFQTLSNISNLTFTCEHPENMLIQRAPFHRKDVPGKQAKHLKQHFDYLLWNFKQVTTIGPH